MHRTPPRNQYWRRHRVLSNLHEENLEILWSVKSHAASFRFQAGVRLFLSVQVTHCPVQVLTYHSRGKETSLLHAVPRWAVRGALHPGTTAVFLPNMATNMSLSSVWRSPSLCASPNIIRAIKWRRM